MIRRIYNRRDNKRKSPIVEKQRSRYDESLIGIKTSIDHVVFVLQAVKAENTPGGGEDDQGKPNGSRYQDRCGS